MLSIRTIGELMTDKMFAPIYPTYLVHVQNFKGLNFTEIFLLDLLVNKG